MPGKVCQGFAVYLDIAFMQTIDKSAVAHIVHSAGSVNAADPQAAELAFFKLTMSKSEGHRAFDGLAGYAVSFAPAAKIASGCQHVFFSSAMGGYVIGNSRHLYSPLHSQHSVNSFLIGFYNDGAGAKVTFQFGALLSLYMCGFGVVTHDFSGAG
jgi:hypothetical protein